MSTIEVCFINSACALVRGYGSRELLVELRHRAPLWSSLDRAWVTQEKTVRDLIALAESRGRTVTIVDEGALRLTAADEATQERQAAAQARGLLW